MFKRKKELLKMIDSLNKGNSILMDQNNSLVKNNIYTVKEYDKLKEQNNYLEDRLNIIRHELTKDYDMFDKETKLENITSIIHDYYSNN